MWFIFSRLLCLSNAFHFISYSMILFIILITILALSVDIAVKLLFKRARRKEWSHLYPQVWLIYILRWGSFISSGIAGHSVGRFCNFLFGFILVIHGIVKLSGKAQRAESSHFLFPKDCSAQVARKKQGIKKIICRLWKWLMTSVLSTETPLFSRVPHSEIPLLLNNSSWLLQESPSLLGNFEARRKSSVSLYRENLYLKWQLWLHLWDSFQWRK